jgi:hypothetical protein
VGRRVLLGALLAVTALYWLVRELELDVEVLLDYLLASALLVGAAMAAALLAAAVIRMFRKR